jgi:serine/threonine protein kinase
LYFVEKGINNIVHRDLKPANLLVDNMATMRIKVSANYWCCDLPSLHGALWLTNCERCKRARTKCALRQVTDFGFSQLRVGDRELIDEKGAKGSALWMAPEVRSVPSYLLCLFFVTSASILGVFKVAVY